MAGPAAQRPRAPPPAASRRPRSYLLGPWMVVVAAAPSAAPPPPPHAPPPQPPVGASARCRTLLLLLIACRLQTAALSFLLIVVLIRLLLLLLRPLLALRGALRLLLQREHRRAGIAAVGHSPTTTDQLKCTPALLNTVSSLKNSSCPSFDVRACRDDSIEWNNTTLSSAPALTLASGAGLPSSAGSKPPADTGQEEARAIMTTTARVPGLGCCLQAL